MQLMDIAEDKGDMTTGSEFQQRATITCKVWIM